MKKTYELKTCPKCGDKKIRVIIGEKGNWECACGWKGHIPKIQSVSSKEYLKFAEEVLG